MVCNTPKRSPVFQILGCLVFSQRWFFFKIKRQPDLGCGAGPLEGWWPFVLPVGYSEKIGLQGPLIIWKTNGRRTAARVEFWAQVLKVVWPFAKIWVSSNVFENPPKALGDAEKQSIGWKNSGFVNQTVKLSKKFGLFSSGFFFFVKKCQRRPGGYLVCIGGFLDPSQQAERFAPRKLFFCRYFLWEMKRLFGFKKPRIEKEFQIGAKPSENCRKKRPTAKLT